MSPQFTEDYDPGFLNVPGFGQSATNPLSPVFYDSLGVVKDLSVYRSIYAARSVNAGESFNVGESYLSTIGFNLRVPATFHENVSALKNVSVEAITDTRRLIVNGKEFVPTTISAWNGNFLVLASV